MSVTAVLALARGLTGLLQNGSLQRYLALLVLMALAAGAWPFLQGTAPAARPAPLHLDGLNPGYVAVWAIGMAATVGTVLAWRQRLLAVVLMLSLIHI